MAKENLNKHKTEAMPYDALLDLVKPLPDNGSVEFWGKLDSLKDNEWHYILIMVSDGIRTNYVDGAIV